jgi:hypothetical protein
VTMAGAASTPLTGLVLTFNCGRAFVDPVIFAKYVTAVIQEMKDISSTGRTRVPGSLPDIIFLSLQEVAPIAHSFLGGWFLEAFLTRYDAAVEILGEYVRVGRDNVGMTAGIIYVKKEIKERVRSVESAGVGVGWWGCGNKGGVGLRVHLGGEGEEEGETVLTFVGAHLAAMEWMAERRNEDWKGLCQGLVFVGEMGASEEEHRGSVEEEEPLISTPRGKINETGIYHRNTHLFLAGDLNYRTSSTSPPASAYLMYPQPVSQPADPKHYAHLLPCDQLCIEKSAGRTLHGLHEAEIAFPPTYKYSDTARQLAGVREDKLLSKDSDDAMKSEPEQWHWSKHRWPSWCDRVLYFPHDVVVHVYNALPLLSSSDHRPVAMAFSIPKTMSEITRADDERDWMKEPPFALDPEWRTKRAAARRREILVGFGAYFGTTWEGRAVLIAIAVGAVGGWWMLGR